MINATDCSDEEILKYIQETNGADELHWSWKWIIFRTLKILVREHLERKEILQAGLTKEEKMEDTLIEAPGTLTEEEKKELDELGVSLAPTGRLP